MNSKHPIIQSYQKTLEEAAFRKANKAVKERFIPERWHVVSLVAVISGIISIFRTEAIILSAFCIVALVIEPLLNKKEIYSVGTISKKDDSSVIANLEEE